MEKKTMDDHSNNNDARTSSLRPKKRSPGNREAVRKYRERKKAHTAYLEEEVKKLRLLNQQLVRKFQSQAILEAEAMRLRALLVDLRGKMDNESGAFSFQKQCGSNTRFLSKEDSCNQKITCQPEIAIAGFAGGDGHVDPSDMLRILDQGNQCSGSNMSAQTSEGMTAILTTSSSFCNEEIFGPKSHCEFGLPKPNAKRDTRVHDGDEGKKTIPGEDISGRIIGNRKKELEKESCNTCQVLQILGNKDDTPHDCI